MKRKALALCLLVVLVAPIMLLIQTNSVLSNVEAAIPKPSVPEFTVKLIDNSYDVPPTTISHTNGYTNETTTETIPGYHVENRTIEYTIKNQPFPSTIDGNASNLYYDIRFKGHFEEDWGRYYDYDLDSPYFLPAQSSSEYTVLSHQAHIPSGGQVDFQVETILGYKYEQMTWYHGILPMLSRSFVYESSGWSATQTITPVQIKVMSPKAENYTVSDVPLTFTVDNPVSEIKYSLDGQENITISGNTTLTGLPNGAHNITVYANDTSGNTAKSETVSFIVAMPFPTELVAVAIVVSVGLIGIGLLVYFKKRKRIGE